MDVDCYTTILAKGLLLAADEAMGGLWTLQQDSASIRTAKHTRSWLKNDDVDVLERLARFPDLNVTENV